LCLILFYGNHSFSGLLEFTSLPTAVLEQLMRYLDLKSILRLSQINKYFYEYIFSTEEIWRGFYDRWFGYSNSSRRGRTASKKEPSINYKKQFQKLATELPPGAMSEMLDTMLWPTRGKKIMEEEEDSEDYEMKEEYVYRIFGNPQDGYSFRFKGKSQDKEYIGWAQKYYDHWVVSPCHIPKTVLDTATLHCYQHMRDFLEVDFDYLEEEEEDGELSLEGTLHDKAFKKISPQEAYTSLERLGIWVTRNFWEFERPPMEGAQPGDAAYVLTFNNDWSEHHMWCLIDPENNTVSFDSCFVNHLFDHH